MPWVDQGAMRASRDRIRGAASRTQASEAFAQMHLPHLDRILAGEGGYRWQRG